MRHDHLKIGMPFIIAALALALQGCGHKGPLMLPAPQVQTPKVQTSSPEKSGSQAIDQPQSPAK